MLERLSERAQQWKDRKKSVEDKEQVKAARLIQFKADAQALRALMGDPRTESYVRLLREAQKAFRARQHTFGMEAGQSPSEFQIGWLAGRIELITEILEMPEQFARVLAEQDNGQSVEAHRAAGA